MRKSGGIGVCASLQDAIVAWPKDMPIDVIVADFCSGLTRQSLFLPIAMAAGATHKNTVLSVNMMRGRDAQGNDTRALIRNLLKTAVIKGASQEDICYLAEQHSKNRAVCFYEWVLGSCSRNTKWNVFQDIPNEYNEFRARIDEHCRPAFHSYMSTSGQVFDSVVMRWPLVVPVGCKVNVKMSDKTGARISKAKRRIAALRAVRTVKQRNGLA